MSDTLDSIRIVDMPDLGVVNDNSSVVGERSGSGRFSAPALRTYVRSDAANVRDFGARGDGANDDTGAIQAALNTGRAVRIPAGIYRITSQLAFSTPGQSIVGDGRRSTIIRVSPSTGFTTGIFVVTNPTPAIDAGHYFADFTLSMSQPDTANRASLNAYPPAFYLYQTTRVQMENVRIVGGIDGIFMYGNCGGFRGFGLDFGNFGRNIYIDGNLDVTSFTDCEVWPFSERGIMTANQMSIMADQNCYGILSLRNDYLDWKGGLFLCGRAAVFQNQPSGSQPGPTYGHFTGTGFDTYGGLEVSAGNILTDNCVFSVAGGVPSPGSPAKNCVTHTGGHVTVRGAYMTFGSLLTNNSAAIYSNVPSGDASLIVDNTRVELGPLDQRAIYVTPSSSLDLSLVINGNKFDRSPTGAYTTSIIELNGGYGSVTGNVCSRWNGATGATSFLAVNTGTGPINVRGNSSNGWTTTVNGNPVAVANLLSIPAVFGEGMAEVAVTGSGTIGGMTYAAAGVTTPFAGQIVTLLFAAPVTVNTGTVGVAGQFILNGRTNFAGNANSSLTVQLNFQGNWQEIGRCL